MRMEGKLATLRPIEVTDAKKFVELINDERTKIISVVFSNKRIHGGRMDKKKTPLPITL